MKEYKLTYRNQQVSCNKRYKLEDIIMDKTSLTMATKTIKHLKINLTINVPNFYEEKF